MTSRHACFYQTQYITDWLYQKFPSFWDIKNSIPPNWRVVKNFQTRKPSILRLSALLKLPPTDAQQHIKENCHNSVSPETCNKTELDPSLVLVASAVSPSIHSKSFVSDIQFYPSAIHKNMTPIFEDLALQTKWRHVTGRLSDLAAEQSPVFQQK